MDNPVAPRILCDMNREHDVIIAGGGLNGPALALALARAGLRVCVIDARPAEDRASVGFDGRAYALALASVRLLQAIGVWPQIKAKAQPILSVRTTDNLPGQGPWPFFLSFEDGTLEEGPMGHMVEDRHLYAAFLEAMRAEARITLLSGETVSGQGTGPGSIMVTTGSGREIVARVLAGCDGRSSGTAQRAGIGRSGWGYGQTALVAAIGHENPHEGVASQVFLPNGPLAILPLAGGHVSSIVWSETDANAARIAAMDDTAFLDLLRPRFGDHLGAIHLAGPRFSYPLNLTLAQSYVAERLALVGDAAHGVHPIAGQGLNLGLRDVGALAEVLVEAHRRGEDIGAIDVLERYQRWRRFDSTVLALGMDGVNRLFSNTNPLLRAARGLGMAVVGALPGVQRAFVRQAAGVAGDLPRLLTGRAL
jgi:2-octaprenyl-6-methoxyphenol hydroxylase